MQNNYFRGTPPNDCFCLKIWSRYNYNKSVESLKVFWYEEVVGTWMKIKICWYYINYGKRLSKFSNEQKNIFHAYSFQLCSKANSKFAFNVSLYEINCFKFETLSLVSKSIYFSWDSLCFIDCDVIICQRQKKFKLAKLFFHSRESRGLILQTLRDLILQSRNFQSLIGDSP